MTQDETDREVGRLVRQALAKVIDCPCACEIDVSLDVVGYGPAMVRLQISNISKISKY